MDAWLTLEMEAKTLQREKLGNEIARRRSPANGQHTTGRGKGRFVGYLCKGSVLVNIGSPK